MKPPTAESGFTMVGTIRLYTSYEGSKSSRPQPFLESANGERTPIHVAEENPFEELTLKNLEGSRVEIRGEFKQGVFVVMKDDIAVLNAQQKPSS